VTKHTPAHQTFLAALRMEKNKLAAARIRARYLLQQLELCLASQSDVASYDAWQIVEELSELFHQAPYTIRQSNSPNIDRITDDDIFRARAFPVEKLIWFVKGKAQAWCHEDRRPSLSWDKKHNAAHCFPCGKSFGPIDILMIRDGLSFKDAVKQLR